MTSLADKVIGLHRALAAADLAHAFGGALALAWCTRAPRATSDIDCNVFLDPDRAEEVAWALPDDIRVGPADLGLLRRDGQVRVWWGSTPLDLFCSTTPFHDDVAARIHWEPFAGRLLPFLSCADLAVFKAVFNRRRDWADLEDMIVAGAIDVGPVASVLLEHLGAADGRLNSLAAIRREHPAG